MVLGSGYGLSSQWHNGQSGMVVTQGLARERAHQQWGVAEHVHLLGVLMRLQPVWVTGLHALPSGMSSCQVAIWLVRHSALIDYRGCGREDVMDIDGFGAGTSRM